MNDENRYLEFEKYIRQGGSREKDKAILWKTAIGLQDVDRLHISDYLLQTAKEQIEGKISITTAVKRIEDYYGENTDRVESEERTKEADIVAARIVKILEEKTFRFSSEEWKKLHKRMFQNVLNHAGMIRVHNISKEEQILNGDTVFYAPADRIRETLDYDFGMEKEFAHEGVSAIKTIRHIAKFTAGIWQIHPFYEGNTRATAVFIMKYLKSLGYYASTEVFAEHSLYFRNALVRANYRDHRRGTAPAGIYLYSFFENMLLGTLHKLQNDSLTIKNTETSEHHDKQGVCIPENLTLGELSILRILKEEPNATQKRMSVLTGKPEGTIKKRITAMQEKGLIGQKLDQTGGKWVILSKNAE